MPKLIKKPLKKSSAVSQKITKPIVKINKKILLVCLLLFSIVITLLIVQGQKDSPQTTYTKASDFSLHKLQNRKFNVSTSAVGDACHAAKGACYPTTEGCNPDLEVDGGQNDCNTGEVCCTLKPGIGTGENCNAQKGYCTQKGTCQTGEQDLGESDCSSNGYASCCQINTPPQCEQLQGLCYPSSEGCDPANETNNGQQDCPAAQLCCSPSAGTASPTSLPAPTEITPTYVCGGSNNCVPTEPPGTDPTAAPTSPAGTDPTSPPAPTSVVVPTTAPVITSPPTSNPGSGSGTGFIGFLLTIIALIIGFFASLLRAF